MIARLRDLVEARARQFALTPDELLGRDAPGGLERPSRRSANGFCHLLEGRDSWLALNLARPEDHEVIPALTGRTGEPWRDLAQAAMACNAIEFRDRAIELQLPFGLLGESKPLPLPVHGGLEVPGKVVDLSALWAGPLCAGLLASAGAEVTRIENVGRPDPTSVGSPLLDTRINSAKHRVALDLRTSAGRLALCALLDGADVLVTSARPAALQRLGLTPQRFPHLTWVAITGHGFSGTEADRVGFGDDCAVAGGLVVWQGNEPHFLGDALADPLTGLEAALTVLAGQRGLIDMAMARVAAAYAGLLA